MKQAVGALGVVALVFMTTLAPARAEGTPPPPSHPAIGAAADLEGTPADRLKDLPVHASADKRPPTESVPGQLVVRYKPSVTARAQSASIADADAQLADSSGELALVKTDPADLAATQAALEADPNVVSVEPNHISHAAAIPNDPSYPAQAPALNLLRVPQNWAVTAGRPVKVAIIDSGIDTDHPDLVGRIADAETFLYGDTPQDVLGHGTAVAGIIAATANNGIGISGVAPNVKLYSLKVMNDQGEATDYDIASAIARAIELRVDIVNMSFGSYASSSVIEDGVASMMHHGLTAIAAAGNDGVWGVEYPAAYPGVVAVGATDDTGDPVWFSNHGPGLSVVAPGLNVTSTKLAAGAVGAYDTFSGTSFSAAYVSGVAALRPPTSSGIGGLGVSGERRGFELMRTAQDRGVPGFDTSYGYGIADAFAMLRAGRTPGVVPTAAAGDADGTLDRAAVIGTHATADISPPTDEDWFAYDVTTPGRLTVTVTPPAFVGNRARELDPEVEIYDSQRRLLLARDREGPGEVESPSVNAVVGRYYVHVDNYMPSASPGAYAVDITSGVPYQPETWTGPTTLDAGTPEFRTTAGDFTGDGRIDLVAMHWTTGPDQTRIRVYPRNAAGGYDAPLVLTIPSLAPADTLQVADLNDDGFDDLLTGAPLRIYWGSAAGLTVGPTFVFDGNTWGTGDMDGDGDVQLLLESATTLDILTWNGTTFDHQSIGPALGNNARLAVADLDDDGLLDVARVTAYTVDVRSRITGSWASMSFTPPAGTNYDVLAADVTGDDHADLLLTQVDVITSDVSATLYVQEAGELVERETVATPNAVGFFPAVVVPDGTPTVVMRTGHGEEPNPVVYRYDDGNLHELGTLPVTAPDPVVADVDGDGYDDIITINPSLQVFVHGTPAPTVPQGGAWVRNTTPVTNSSAASLTANLDVTAARDLKSTTVTGDNVWLMEGRSGDLVPAAVSYSAANRRITLNPTASLLPSTAYTLVVAGVTGTDDAPMPLVLVGFRTAAGAMPAIAINGTYTPIAGDFNGDEASDVFWYSNGGSDSAWQGGGAGIRSLGSFAGWPAGMRPQLGDIDGDNWDDFIAYTPGTANGPDYIVPGDPAKGDLMKGYSYINATYVPLTGDFDGDGFDDLFWYGPGTTADVIWYGEHESTKPWRTRTLNVNGTYRPAVGDFNGDGFDDVFWHGPGSAGDSWWKGGPNGFTSVSYTINGSYYPFAGDFDGNGFDDLIFYGPGTTPDAFWMFSKTGYTSKSATANGTYRPATGDYNGDGFDDILWYAPGTAADRIGWGSPTGST